jgi:hypothetical protein
MYIDTVADFRKAIRVGPYAWPGGYDLYFMTSDGAALCHGCATKERRSVIDSIATKCNDGWRVVAVDATCNTDSEVRCDHCATVLQEDMTEGTEADESAEYDDYHNITL